VRVSHIRSVSCRSRKVRMGRFCYVQAKILKFSNETFHLCHPCACDACEI